MACEDYQAKKTGEMDLLEMPFQKPFEGTAKTGKLKELMQGQG